MGTVFLIIGLLLFVGLVVVHELGHALIAKRNGVEVEEFGIGFPPRAWSKKLKNKTLFTLNWLPLGGFVRLKGEYDSATGPGTYGGASLWVKTKILLAGVMANWLMAIVIFTVLALVGMPKILPNQFSVSQDAATTIKAVRVAQVVDSSPAQKSGLQTGDALISFAHQPVTTAEQFQDLTKQYAGQEVDVEYSHNQDTKTVKAQLNVSNDDGKGYFGIGVGSEETVRSTWSAPIVGVGLTLQFTYETFKGLGDTLANLFTAHFAEAGANVTGPVGIFTILNSSAQNGIVSVLFLIGIISLTLAVMNVLPIPALDGGRLATTVAFRLAKKNLTKEREEAIQATGMFVLLGLMLLITVLDVKRFF